LATIEAVSGERLNGKQQSGAANVYVYRKLNAPSGLSGYDKPLTFIVAG